MAEQLNLAVGNCVFLGGRARNGPKGKFGATAMQVSTVGCRVNICEVSSFHVGSRLQGLSLVGFSCWDGEVVRHGVLKLCGVFFTCDRNDGIHRGACSQLGLGDFVSRGWAGVTVPECDE